MLSKLFRKRAIDEQFLRHSEWARRLGIPLVISLAGIKSISMMLFVILPVLLTQIAGPSTVFALIFAFLIIFLAGSHLAELSCAMPKNCVHYHFAYSIVGELPAFLIAWISLADYIAQAALFCRSWADHFNLLFRNLPSKAFTFDAFSEDSKFLSKSFDSLSVLAAFITLLLLLCSLRVVGTICVSLLAVTLLVSASCSLVAFFHLDPDNWLKAQFFTFGYKGVLHAICALCACYTGVESTSCLLEETKNPRKRIASVISFLVVTLTTMFFLVSLVFSLSTNVSELNDNSLIPEIFTVLNIPAAKSDTVAVSVKRYPTIVSSNNINLTSTAFRSFYEQGFKRMRYMLSVCSVCALSGGVLASFLPATRTIAALCQDRLIPYAKDTSTKSPYFAVLLCTILVSICSLIQKNILLNIVIFMSPIKLMITISLVYFQHFLPEPIGIPEETSNYKSIGKKHIRIRIDDGVSIDESVENRSDDSSMASHSSFDTTAFLYLKATKLETERLQKKLEKEQRNNEKQPVMAKSVSQYQSMGSSSRPTQKEIHNCIADQCGKEREEGCDVSDHVHLFSCEEPEVPFFSSFPSTPRPQSPSMIPSHYRKAQLLFFAFFVSTMGLALHIRHFSTENNDTSHILNSAFILVVIALCVVICKLQTNDYLHKRTSHVPLFPFISLLPMFLLVVSFSGSIPITTFYHIGIIIFTGLILYFLYGYRYSKERNSRCVIIENRFSGAQNREEQEYCPIIGNDTSSEM